MVEKAPRREGKKGRQRDVEDPQAEALGLIREELKPPEVAAHEVPLPEAPKEVPAPRVAADRNAAAPREKEKDFIIKSTWTEVPIDSNLSLISIPDGYYIKDEIHNGLRRARFAKITPPRATRAVPEDLPPTVAVTTPTPEIKKAEGSVVESEWMKQNPGLAESVREYLGDSQGNEWMRQNPELAEKLTPKIENESEWLKQNPELAHELAMTEAREKAARGDAQGNEWLKQNPELARVMDEEESRKKETDTHGQEWIKRNEGLEEAVRKYAEARKEEIKKEAGKLGIGEKGLTLIRTAGEWYKGQKTWKKIAFAGGMVTLSASGGILVGGTLGAALLAAGMTGSAINRTAAACAALVTAEKVSSWTWSKLSGEEQKLGFNRHLVAGLSAAALVAAMPTIMRESGAGAFLGHNLSLAGNWLTSHFGLAVAHAAEAGVGSGVAVSPGTRTLPSFPVPQGGFDTPTFDSTPEVENVSPGSELGDVPGPRGTLPRLTPTVSYSGEYPLPGPDDLASAHIESPGVGERIEVVAPATAVHFVNEIKVPGRSNTWNAIRSSLPDDLTGKQRENMTGNIIEYLKAHPKLNPGIKDLAKIKPDTILHLPSEEILKGLHSHALSLNAAFPTPPVPPTPTPLALAIETATGKPPMIPVVHPEPGPIRVRPPGFEGVTSSPTVVGETLSPPGPLPPVEPEPSVTRIPLKVQPGGDYAPDIPSTDISSDTFRPISAGVEPPEFEPNELGMNPGAEDQAPPVSTTPETPAGSQPTPSTEGLAVPPVIATPQIVTDYAVNRLGGESGFFAGLFGNLSPGEKIWQDIATQTGQDVLDPLKNVDLTFDLEAVRDDLQTIIQELPQEIDPATMTVEQIYAKGIESGVLKVEA